jgi:quercetin dioxygenase-like cupin family protein
MSTPTPFTHLADVAAMAEPPEGGILSRTIFQDERLKAVVFGFAAGEELSEHTAAVPAVLHVLRGEGELGLGDETVAAAPGAWVHMPAGLTHSVRARTAMVMLLLMLKGGEPR